MSEVEKGNPQVSVARPSKSSTNKMEYQKKRDFEKRKRLAQRKVEKTEENIARLEKEIEALDQLMLDPDNIKDQAVFSRYEKLKSELFHQMEDWEKHQMALEKLNKSRN
jgi:ATP-binding cassette subfamily F protein 3